MKANLAALRTLRELEAGGRQATAAEKAVLARWSGWGALPAVFDSKAAAYGRYAAEREELRRLLSADDYAAAERSTINAHFTDASYADAIWGAVKALGFEGGTVLEPGCGSGNFVGLAPEGATVVGVELEPVTAGIAAALYPEADIRQESFADTRMPDGTVDLTVGNVPFGNVVLHDRKHNAAGHAIHNHFIVKGLALTRPGGLMAMVTSRYTMDASNPAARREIAELADLVGAVRLPTGAHRRAAGTDVVTDVLIFRRREEGRDPGGESFERSRPVTLTGPGANVPGAEPIRMNEYFEAHPEHVLGKLEATQADLGRTELGVVGDRAAGPALVQALAGIVEHARTAGLVMTPRQGAPAPKPVALVAPSARRPDGFLLAKPGGAFARVVGGVEVAYEPPASQARELHALLGLRDTAVALLEAEAATVDDSQELDGLRADLNRRYDDYALAFGPINRFSWRRTGRVDATTGEEKLARANPAQGGFKNDPFANVVRALEVFDPSTQRATKAPIFRERVVAKKAPRLGADSPADALAICLDSYGEVRMPEIARLLGVEPEEARAQLAELVFDEPETGRVVPAAEYLSGNVRVKLVHAQEAAQQDGRFAGNVAALVAVQPRDLGPDEIDAKMGAAWIGAEHVRQFLSEILEDDTVQVEHPGSTIWAVKSDFRVSVLAQTQWGTERYGATDVAEALLEQREIRLYDEGPDGERVFNATATLAAVEKANEMQARFREWVWEEPGRAATLAKTYNETFNALVPRSYDGVVLSLPGLARSFKPLPHQVAAVARIINEPATLLAHEVGAGKTAEMVIGAMELRRLGLVSKPVVVVPNHMLDEFTRQWLQLYPQAKLLAAGKEDLERDNRRLFVAKSATGEWDGIVMTRSAFERIPMSPAVQKHYLEREVEAIDRLLESARETSGRLTLKRIQRMKQQAEERLKEKLDGAKDPGIRFEETGMDYVFCDEAHGYKNLRTASKIPGMSVEGSQRAQDLHMKLEWLRARGVRVGTLATATPIANSMGEAFTMQRFLRPDLLEAAGVQDFDVWAATFGETSTAIEVAPDGSGLRMKTRFAKFRNVPELLLLWRVSADIKTAEDLKLPVPPLAPRAADGERLPTTVVVPPSEELRAFVGELAQRAEAVRRGGVDPTEDNFLRISSDGRAAALDLRLVGQETAEDQKVTIAAERIAAIYEARKGDTFPGADGEPHPTPGALQLVFSDLGTPTGDGWNVYDQLRTELVARGVPKAAIRFVHEARNDREKAELFAACRDGRVAVLLGSTERMGVGTNVQMRAAAEHHLDCPWRPADLAQREGRIVRQGNENPDVEILRYVTEGSFDAYLWQTVQRKAQFIGQVMRGRLDVREIEDVGEQALSYNEVKALATGNPLLLEQAQVEAEVKRFERLERSHANNQNTLKWTAREADVRIGRTEQRVAGIEAAIAARVPMPPDAFSVTVGSRTFEKRAEANEVLRRMLKAQIAGAEGPRPVGKMCGFTILAERDRLGSGVTISLAGVPDSDVSMTAVELERALPVGRLEHRVMTLEASRDSALAEGKRLRAERERANRELGKPFRHSAELDGARGRLAYVSEQIALIAAPKEAARPGEAEEPRKVLAEALERNPTMRKWLAEGEALEERWTAACSTEVGRVRGRAEGLLGRANKAVGEQGRRLDVHAATRPARPNVLVRAVTRKADYQAKVDAWGKEHSGLAKRARQLERRAQNLREFAKEPTPGYPTRGTRLAEQLVKAREPELAKRVEGFRKWRAAIMKSARDNQRAGPAVPGRESAER